MGRSLLPTKDGRYLVRDWATGDVVVRIVTGVGMLVGVAGLLVATRLVALARVRNDLPNWVTFWPRSGSFLEPSEACCFGEAS